MCRKPHVIHAAEGCIRLKQVATFIGAIAWEVAKAWKPYRGPLSVSSEGHSLYKEGDLGGAVNLMCVGFGVAE